jgi:4-hydroxy-tetrahydrodipicolinate reductase
MPINVLVNGAFGRMGLSTVKAISEHPGLTLVGQIGREYNLKESIKDSKADVVVDFTLPDAVYHNALTIIDTGARPVIGTSGLTREQVHQLQETSRKLKRGGIIAPNFSLGAVLMMKHAKEIARYMSHVEIIEMHHDNKVDSPSGTAMLTADLIAQAQSQVNQPIKTSKEILPHARGATHHNVPIHSVRLPGFLAMQEVIFGNTGETLTLRHNSIDRASFMPGVCLACEKVMGLEELIYGLEQVL